MTDATVPLPEPSQTDAPANAAGGARGRIEGQLRTLEELTAIGMEAARAVERRAVAAGPEADVEAIARAYAKAARAVRLTVMLQSRLAQDLKTLDSRAELDRQCEARAAAAAEEARRRDPEYVHKVRVENVVERVAREACGEDEAALDRLMIEAWERLDDEDLYGKVLSRPVGELVALVCRDLGLSPDWARLAEQAWAREEIASGAKGSPFLAAGTGSAEGRTGPPEIGDTHLRSLSPRLSWFDGPEDAEPAFANTG